MMLTTKGRYAVMAMVDIARHCNGSPVTLAEIALRQGITTAYLEQLFARMRKCGLVKSVRGPGGGYLLARNKDEITVADIICAADEPMKMTRCKSTGCAIKGTKCLTHDLWDGLSAQIQNYLSSISLQDVCEGRVINGGSEYIKTEFPDNRIQA